MIILQFSRDWDDFLHNEINGVSLLDCFGKYSVLLYKKPSKIFTPTAYPVSYWEKYLSASSDSLIQIDDGRYLGVPAVD